MKYLLASCALTAVLACGTIGCATHGVVDQERSDLEYAPPAPAIYYAERPTFVMVPGTEVYWWRNRTGDFDLYRMKGEYYVVSNGWWYRGSGLRRPYHVVRENRVPNQVFVAMDFRARNGDQWATEEWAKHHHRHYGEHD